mgnify:CR=1 FL=1
MFSLIGVATEDDTSSSNAIYGGTIGLANLLNHEEDYHKIANIIQIHKLKNILGINDEEEQE